MKSCSCIIWAIFSCDLFNAVPFVSVSCLVAVATKTHCNSKIICRVVSSILMIVLCRDSVASSIVGAWAGWWRPGFPPDASSLAAREVPCTLCGCVSVEACRLHQQRYGCHACDKKGCWTENRTCTFYRRSRANHVDASMGDNVPHISQTSVQI